MNRSIQKSIHVPVSGKTAARLVAGGFATGVINGFFGSGGGIIAIFLLSSLKELDFDNRGDIFANVSAAILPISVASALVYSSISSPDMGEALSVAAAGLAGGAVGALLSKKISSAALNKIFAAVMIISGSVMLFSR